MYFYIYISICGYTFKRLNLAFLSFFFSVRNVSQVNGRLGHTNLLQASRINNS